MSLSASSGRASKNASSVAAPMRVLRSALLFCTRAAPLRISCGHAQLVRRSGDGVNKYIFFNTLKVTYEASPAGCGSSAIE